MAGTLWQVAIITVVTVILGWCKHVIYYYHVGPEVGFYVILWEQEFLVKAEKRSVWFFLNDWNSFCLSTFWGSIMKDQWTAASQIIIKVITVPVCNLKVKLYFSYFFKIINTLKEFGKYRKYTPENIRITPNIQPVLQSFRSLSSPLPSPPPLPTPPLPLPVLSCLLLLLSLSFSLITYLFYT